MSMHADPKALREFAGFAAAFLESLAAGNGNETIGLEAMRGWFVAQQADARIKEGLRANVAGAQVNGLAQDFRDVGLAAKARKDELEAKRNYPSLICGTYKYANDVGGDVVVCKAPREHDGDHDFVSNAEAHAAERELAASKLRKEIDEAADLSGRLAFLAKSFLSARIGYPSGGRAERECIKAMRAWFAENLPYEKHDDGHPHLIGGEFQSDKYPTCPRGKVPLSVKDPTAQDLLMTYARRRRAVDAEFATDLEAALLAAGYAPAPVGFPGTDAIEDAIVSALRSLHVRGCFLTGDDNREALDAARTRVSGWFRCPHVPRMGNTPKVSRCVEMEDGEPIGDWFVDVEIDPRGNRLTPDAADELADGLRKQADMARLEMRQVVPSDRVLELAERLVAPGPKACAISASECHEISEFIFELDARRLEPHRKVKP